MENLFEGNFIHDFIDEDLEKGVYDHVQTRFPPEPNGYLHVGHIKAIALNWSTAKKYGGRFNLRLDDTNPSKEDDAYVQAIIRDHAWLGCNPDSILYGSDYFDACYEAALTLIKKGKAYVCQLTAEEMREYRGTLTQPGRNSPYRDRPVQENLRLFEEMRQGVHPEGSMVLRAKIDMQSPNLNLRDPAIYRIMYVTHHRQGDKWCIYPLYDFNHPISDTVEGVTHSLCTLEFEDHRPLYEWVLRECELPAPSRQIEFAKLNLDYCIMSKRRLIKVVEAGVVSGWDDPRMATIVGMRRRGFPPEALLAFVNRAGMSKSYSIIDYGVLEQCVRDQLNHDAPRAMAVLRPLRVTIENYPQGQSETLEVEIHPEKPELGTRAVSFSRNLFIERDDFLTTPVKGWHRMAPGAEVRFKGAYFLTCKDVVTDEAGEVTELICTYDPLSRGGESPDGRKVRGTIHWVDAESCVRAKVNLYDRLSKVPNPSKGEILDNINPDSLEVIEDAVLERQLAESKPGDTFQFMRLGYFCVDTDSAQGALVFNRTVTLKDSWAKQK